MNKFNLWFRQNSPTILMVSSIVTSGAAIVLACFATKNLPEVTKPAGKKIVQIHKNMEKKPEKEKEYKKELAKVYTKTGLKIAGMYAPAVISFSLSVASIVGSHNILKGRNAALAAAVATIKGGYDAYRQRVRNKYGDEEELAIYNGETVETIKEKDENGKQTTKAVVKKDEHAHDSDFSVLWGPGCMAYDNSHPQCNVTFLLEAEERFNRRLVARGYVFLYEIYEYLGLPESYLGENKLKASRVLGWVYDKSNPDADNFISFGIRDKDGILTQAARNIQLGVEDSIWLEFNYDGDILTGDYGKPTFMKMAIKKGM